MLVTGARPLPAVFPEEAGMSKVSRLRAARSSIAPCVMTVMSLAVVCADTSARDARLDSTVQVRVADGGGGERRTDEPRDGRAARPMARR
jgi:hypothetical protein